MVLTQDLTRLNPRFSREPICPETSSNNSLSRAQQHHVARKLTMSPEDIQPTVSNMYSNIHPQPLIVNVNLVC